MFFEFALRVQPTTNCVALLNDLPGVGLRIPVVGFYPYQVAPQSVKTCPSRADGTSVASN